tara:strand:+ start:324 stop:593 length:270 start_codon:yes stop_codon:yes gene_type:complete
MASIDVPPGVVGVKGWDQAGEQVDEHRLATVLASNEHDALAWFYIGVLQHVGCPIEQIVARSGIVVAQHTHVVDNFCSGVPMSVVNAPV